MQGRGDYRYNKTIFRNSYGVSKKLEGITQSTCASSLLVFLYQIFVRDSMKFILGTKLGMTQVFRGDGTVVPVTRVQAGPCVVTQVKTKEKDGTHAVQVGFGEQKKFRLNRAQQGHLKDILTVRYMKDFQTGDASNLQRGDTFTVNTFGEGDTVQVVGWSKGKGFQGVVKRHGFHGSPASHGHKDQLRMPGSIGATDAARVFKGTRMGGHMGDARVTVKNLEVVEIHPETNELYIKGAVPGARGGLLLISTQDGDIVVEKEEKKEEVVAEEKKDDAVQEEKKEEAKEEKTEAVVEKKEAATPSAQEQVKEEPKA